MKILKIGLIFGVRKVEAYEKASWNFGKYGKACLEQCYEKREEGCLYCDVGRAS
jgi:hypothetical protein